MCGGHFAFFVPYPYIMGVYGLSWTAAVKIWHFKLTQDHLGTEDTKGVWRSLCLFVPNPYNMGVYGLPWTPAVKI